MVGAKCWILCIVTLFIIVSVILVKFMTVNVESDANSLDSDPLYQYLDILEKDQATPINSFSERQDKLNRVCDKYKDPFRVEHRNLYKSTPSVENFKIGNTKDVPLMICNQRRIATKSLLEFLDTPNLQISNLEAADCWPDCSNTNNILIIVRTILNNLFYN